MKNLHVCIRAVSILLVLFSLTALGQVQWVNGPNGGYIKDMVEHKGKFFSMSNYKLFKSGDNAQTWQELDMSFLPFNASLFEFGVNENFLFVRASTGLFRSGDSGNTWFLIRNAVSRLGLHEATLFIYSSTDNKVYRSQNNGETWEQKHSPIIDNTPYYDIGKISFNGDVLFIGSVNAETALYRSGDLGETWEHITAGLIFPDFPQEYIGPVQALFTGPDILLATWLGVYISTDNGLTWAAVLYDEEYGCEKLMKSGDLIIAKGYGHKYWRTINGIEWEDITSSIDLAPKELYSIVEQTSFNTQDAHKEYENRMQGVSAQDGFSHVFSGSDGIYTTTDNLISSQPTDNIGLVAWPTEPSMVVADESFVYVSAGGRIFKTNDHGVSWEKIYEGLSILRKSNDMMWGFSGSSEEYVHYSLDGGLTWYIMYNNNVYYSEDGGLTWTIISNNSPEGSITWMAELNGSLFCTTLGGIYKSVDEGITWVKKTGLLGFWKIYATKTTLFANCITSTDLGIYRSTDFGETWANVGLGNAIYFDWDFIEHNGALFIGVDYTTPRGVWRSTNNGNTWEHVHVGSKFRRFESNGSKVYFSAYNAQTQLNHIYVSANDGNNWTEVTTIAFISSFTVDKNYIYMPSNSDHILRSGNDGADWQNISQGQFMYRPRVTGLKVLNNGLFVGTMRSGYYVLSLVEPTATVNTLFADDITPYSATLYGSVNPNGSACTVIFEYGLTTSYESTVNAVPNEISGDNPILVSALIDNLLPNATYHFRVVATNSGGVYFGNDQSISTQPSNINEQSFGGNIISPNPFNDYIQLNSDLTLVRLLVTNAMGHVVLDLAASKRANVDTRSLPAGVYFFRLIMNDGSIITHKMIKQ